MVRNAKAPPMGCRCRSPTTTAALERSLWRIFSAMHAKQFRDYKSPALGAFGQPSCGRQKQIAIRGRLIPVLCTFLSVVCLRPVQAQTRPDPFIDSVVAIRARHIETVSKAVIHNGIIVIRNGKITAVGTDVKIPAGAKILQAD